MWHRDPNRAELLRGHAANLARQTAPVDPIYIFDGGDEPPSWLEGRTVSVREPLSIYQAWNVALSLVATPLAMNLNLDDRLAPDAVEFLELQMLRTGAMVIGGEWKVCHSQQQTDDVAPVLSRPSSFLSWAIGRLGPDRSRDSAAARANAARWGPQQCGAWRRISEFRASRGGCATERCFNARATSRGGSCSPPIPTARSCPFPS